MEYVYIAIAICVALVGSVTDIIQGRVKNKHLILALISWACVVGIDLCISQNISTSPIAVVLNFVLSIIVTCILYVNDIWAPGDGKLFLLIVLIYPLSLSPCMPGNVFPALDIVIYSFAIGYMVLLISALVRKDTLSGKISLVSTIKKITLKRVLNITSNIGLVSILDLGIQRYLSGFVVSNRSLFTLCIVMIVYLMNKKIAVVGRVVGYVGLGMMFIITIAGWQWISFVLTISQSLIISIIIDVFNERIDKNSYREVSGEKVRPGMILSHASIWAMQNCIDPELPRRTTETRRSRLTVSQAKAVQLWCKNAKRNVTIVEMLPFAPCIAIATVIHIVRYIVIYK